jgi:hypothetical protein
MRRAVARRWPALLGAAIVTAAIPTMTLAADFNGKVTFLGGNDHAIEAISSGNAAILGVGNSVPGLTSEGVLGAGDIGVRGDGSNDGIGVKGDSFNKIGVQGNSFHGIGVQAHSETDIGLDASGGLIAISAGSSPNPNNPSAIPAGSIGVVADRVETGVNATGVKTGVRGFSNNGHGVEAQSSHGNALVAQANTQAGTFVAGVQAIGDEAVVARGTTIGLDVTANGSAVAAVSNNGVGGDFSGKEAPIRLGAASTPGAPTSGVHHRGELYVDSNGDLFYCKADGTPGTWKKVSLQ